MSPREPENEDPRPGASAVRSAVLSCESCGLETPHRILRLAATSRKKGTISGIARCSRCRWTHPFTEIPPRTVTVWAVRSEGQRSVRERIELVPGATARINEPIPGLDPPRIVRRIELRDGRTTVQARAEDIATLWTIVDRGPRIRVSLIEGRTTTPTLWEPPEGAQVAVGEPLNVDGVPTFIIGLRGRGQTWRAPGDRLEVREIDRIYARRSASPPAGRRDWSVDREIPSSRERATSISARSRSSPGVRKARIVARSRKADTGAAVQSETPS